MHKGNALFFRKHWPIYWKVICHIVLHQKQKLFLLSHGGGSAVIVVKQNHGLHFIQLLETDLFIELNMHW